MRVGLVSVGTLLLMPALSGCLSPNEAPTPCGPGPDDVLAEDPEAASRIPRNLPGPWDLGRRYHYLGENGIWQNWTVIGVEEKQNYTAYRVLVNWSQPDGGWNLVGTRWVDIDSLGRVFELRGGWERWMTVPWDQILPLGDKSYDVTWHGKGGVEAEGSVQVVTGERVTRSVPAGTFLSVEINYHVDGPAPETRTHWYAPEVGYYVSFIDQRSDFGPTRFQLAAWCT